MPQSRATVFTELSVRRLPLPPQGEQIDYVEKLKQGRTLQLRVSYGGAKAWRVIYYINGKARAKTLGRYHPERDGHMGVKAAREAADKFDPKAAYAAAQAGSFKEVAETWLKHYVAKKRLRTQDEI